MSSTSKPKQYKRWLTSSETAEILGKSTRTLRSWRQKCVGPDYKQDTARGPVLYNAASVKAYLDKTMTRVDK